jgi:AraC family transcriptional regulator
MVVQTKNGEYLKRINIVLDYLDQHYAQALNLAVLAKIANFSPFHFHRIFTSIVGESLNKYVQRIRIEKAAGLPRYQAHTPISDIAIDCGFSNSVSFARVFKQHYDVSASEWE